jgi:hypothetical protein
MKTKINMKFRDTQDGGMMIGFQIKSKTKPQYPISQDDSARLITWLSFPERFTANEIKIIQKQYRVVKKWRKQMDEYLTGSTAKWRMIANA